ncbi:MAG: M20 family peptidase [Chloroflexi bacterium]|nr:MAG: M20 family peptidase [Chloroflexota bacterium]
MLSDLEREVLARINPDEVIERTRELVRIPSVYRPEKGETEEKAALWVKALLEDLGLEVHYYDVEPGRPNVIGLYRVKEGQKCLMFEGHTDVVTEGDISKWKYDPFGGEIVDGRLYGRGSADMKGGLVAAIMATKAIVESGVELGGGILIGALADEEGMMIGAKDFARSPWAKVVTSAIICEPEDNRICIAQKGVMWAKIRTIGKMAHGCMPFTGINPITHMATLISALKELEKAEIKRWGSHPFLGLPSITPTAIRAPVEGQGEEQANVIPAQCRVTLDIRLIPGQTPEKIQEQIQALFERLKADDETFKAEFEVLESRPPTATSKDEPIVQVLSQAYRDLTGKEPVYGGVPGTTDGTILHTWANIPIVTCGPGDTHIPHQADEYLDLDQLIEATKLYALAALRYLGVK